MIALFERDNLNNLDKFIRSNIHNDLDLLNFMSSFEYGYFNKKLYIDDDIEYDMKSYLLMIPEQVFKYKVGVCQDQSLFEYYVLNQLGYQNLKLTFIQQFYISTHTFLTYEKNNKLFYFENSFSAYRGIHGPFNHMSEIIETVKRQMIEYIPSKHGFLINEINPTLILNKTNITIEKYLKIAGFDFDKMEVL